MLEYEERELRMKEISVIVPIYNVERYLQACLESIDNQNFDSYEVILVDDGSTDNSRTIAEGFVTKEPDKFRLVSQVNMGQSAARNNGLKIAEGKYIAYMDSDDAVASNYLSTLYQAAIKDDADMVFCAFRSVDENGICLNEVRESSFVPGKVYNIKEDKNLLLMENNVWNKLFKKEIIVENQLFFPDRVWAEDLRFTKKYMTYTTKCVYVDEPLYDYYQRGTSTLHSMKLERTAEILTALDDVSDFYKKKNIYDAYKEEIEFIAIQEIYIYTLVKLIRAGEMGQLKIIRDEFLKRFPEHQKNKYVHQLTKNRKIVYELMNRKLYLLIKLIFIIKG